MPIGAAVGLLVASAGPAVAEPAFINIPPQTRTSALLSLGRQAHLSVGIESGVHCPGFAFVVGRMTTSQALDRILKGSTCEAEVIDARTVLIIARPPPRPFTPRAPKQAVPVGADVSEVIVTASKRPELEARAASGVTALPQALLTSQGAVDAASLPALAAGVTVTNLGPGRDKILIRGLSDGPLTGRTQSTVGIYLDDLRLTYNAPDPDLRWTDVSRVEVLRGPQGSLYGAGSIGGVIQIVSNPPEIGRRSGSVTATGSLTAWGSPSGVLEGFINQPIGRDAAIRIAGWLENDGGYIDNSKTDASNVDRTRRDGFRASVAWEPSTDLSLRATLVNQSINSRDAHYAEPAVGDLKRATATAEPHDNDFRALDLAARWAPAGYVFTANLGLIDHEVASTYDASAAPASLLGSLKRQVTARDDNHIQAAVAELRLTSPAADRIHWLTGLFLAFGEQALSTDIVGADGARGYSEARRDQLLEGAFFGDAIVDLSPQLSVALGGRLYASRAKVHSALSDASLFSGRTSHTGFAPKVLIDFHPTRRLSVYAQAAEGYRAGGLNTGGGLGQTFSVGGGVEPRRAYSGDELWSYEGGLRYSALHGSLRGRLAVFYAYWSNIQSDLLLPSGLPFTANLGDGRTVGVESEVAYVRGGLSVAANGVIENPELDRPDPGFPTRADAGLAGVPTGSFSLRAAYTLPLPRERLIRFSGSISYVGPSRLTFDAQTAPQMGDYIDSRFAATLTSGPASLTAHVENVGDGRGDTFAYGNPFTIRTVRQTTPLRPLTFGLRLTRDF